MSNRSEESLTIQQYAYFLYLRALRGYIEEAKAIAPDISVTFIGALAHTGAMYNPFAYRHPSDSSKPKFSPDYGTGLGKAVGFIPAAIEALIDYVTRRFSRHTDIEQSIRMLDQIKQQSFQAKQEFIQTIINLYRNDSRSTSKGTEALLKALAEEKPIADHLQSIHDYLTLKAPQNETLYYNNGKRMFRLILQQIQAQSSNQAVFSNPVYDNQLINAGEELTTDTGTTDTNNQELATDTSTTETNNQTVSFNTTGASSRDKDSEIWNGYATAWGWGMQGNFYEDEQSSSSANKKDDDTVSVDSSSAVVAVALRAGM